VTEEFFSLILARAEEMPHLSVTIELPDESAALLGEQASAHGLSLEAWIEHLARGRRGESQVQPVRQAVKDLVELFAPLRGLNLSFERNPSTGHPVDL
jgi:hypothetical protein